MRLNRSMLGWGLFFVVLGAVPLAIQAGLVSEEMAGRAWQLWPLLLIAGGIGLILRRTPVEPVASLAGSVIFGLIAGGVIATGSIPVGCGGSAEGTPFSSTSGGLGATATVEVQLNCGELQITPQDGAEWSLNGRADPDDVPAVVASADRLEVDSGNQGFFGAFRDRQVWELSLPREPAIDLDAAVNAGGAVLDLTGMRIGRLVVDVNAGDLQLLAHGATELRELDVELNAVGSPTISLPNLSFSGSIDANVAGSVRICPPGGAGLRLHTDDNPTASNNYAERGLVRVGDAWETPGFDSAAVRIELTTDVNVGRLSLEAEGNCGG